MSAVVKMPSPPQVIVLGPKGVGKSHLANTILGLTADSNDHFIEHNDSSGRRAFGCQRIQNKLPDGTRVRIVDTPGIDASSPYTPRNWQNLVHAFDMTGKRVDCFVIVLDANQPKAGEKMMEFFTTMFGKIAAINALVVFMNSEYSHTQSSERVLRVTHRYLDDELLAGYPLFDAADLSTGKEALLDLIKSTADSRKYTIEDFKQPQFNFARRWVRDIKTVPGHQIQRDKCIEIGVPDILFDRYPEEELLDFLTKSTVSDEAF